MKELLVKRDSVLNAMNKEVFNAVVKQGDEVTILKPNAFDIKDKEGKVVSTSYSFIVKIKSSGKTATATMPGRVLFSARVLKDSLDEKADKTLDENYQTFGEMAAEGDDEQMNITRFKRFVVEDLAFEEETRPAVLAAQAKLQGYQRNPDKRRFSLRDYDLFEETFKANDFKYEELDYDAIYKGGPIDGAKPLQTVKISTK